MDITELMSSLTSWRKSHGHQILQYSCIEHLWNLKHDSLTNSVLNDKVCLHYGRVKSHTLFLYLHVIHSTSVHKLISVLVLRAGWPLCRRSLGPNVPPGHFPYIVQTVPLSTERPSTSIVLERVYKGAMERTGQFEVSSIKEESM